MNTTRWTLLVFLFAFVSYSAHCDELYINGFRNPSIGVEWKIKYASTHTGYYLTNFAPGQTSKFWRTGISLWPVSYAYVSVSHLYGFEGALAKQHAALFEGGAQLIVHENVALRLGVAVLPFSSLPTQVNPTPGVSLRLPF